MIMNEMLKKNWDFFPINYNEYTECTFIEIIMRKFNDKLKRKKNVVIIYCLSNNRYNLMTF